ncbi:glycosyltransferase family 4 protein [Phocaeicola sp.]
MNILFLIYHGFSNSSGISKKILYQIKGMRELGHNVYVCTYSINEKGHRVRMVNDEIITDYGTGRWAAFKKRINYTSICNFAIERHIDMLYVRSFHNANPFTIKLFGFLKQHGIKIAMEIPTYPYDQEYEGFPFITRMGIKIDKIFRRKLARQTDAIVTFSNETTIFGQRTIRISNGIDFENIPIQNKAHYSHSNEIHLIGVAEVHYWHGYDRLIAGLGKYYMETHGKTIYFHIVGGVGPSEMYNSLHAPGFHELMKKYAIEKYIIFHGQQYGEKLNDLFNKADFAIGSLARHRSGITNIKTLKNREYAARGIPFIYSETDSDFDNMPYVLKAPANESAIDVQQLVGFYEKEQWDAHKIRCSINHLSWKEQMKRVLEAI